ncbi:DnaJ homolog subfamily B member 13 [Linum grandiflorum]
MGVDYYDILKVNRSASEDDLKRSYRRLAMKWHPDKNPNNKNDAESRFKDISQAYDALSDPGKRANYDMYGEEGLTETVPSNGGCNSRNAEDIFAEFFGSSSPLFGGFGGARSYSKKQAQETEILTIDVKPGWKKGTKVTFPDKGNEQPNQLPADLVFVIDEKRHDLYKRDGNDLTMDHLITLAEAMGGTTVRITTLDGRSLLIPVNDIISPGYELVVAMEGMPIAKEPGKRGDLRIKFDVKFPTKLTTEQKAAVRCALGA